MTNSRSVTAVFSPSVSLGRWLLFLPLLLLLAVTLTFALHSNGAPERLQFELGWAAPSASRPFGSGEAGVDLLPLITHATLRVLALATVVACIGFGLGTPLGTAAGFARGGFERVVLRTCDLVQSFPTFLLALAVLSAVRVPSRLHIGVVFSITAWAPFARMAAAQGSVLSAAEFVEAARALGVSRARALFGHVLPNLLGPVSIQLGSVAAGVVLGEAALGFVGLGPGDGVSLGAVLDQGVVSMLRAPHVLTVGSLAIFTVSGSLQLACEGVRRLSARRR